MSEIENGEVTKEEAEISPEEQKKLQKELQKHFYQFKKRFKVKSKSELVAIIWQQGMEFKRLQDLAQELYEENKSLKESADEKNS